MSDGIAPTVAFIVSHTHWDREWYLTSHQFRVKLVDVLRQVLDALETDDAFEHFLLDGQTIILEDYLSLRPEDADRVRQLVASGKLAIGPWYVLPDEFLVSGEAHARNLLIGRQVAGPFGPVQQVGYMPDSFGHIAQMPQLLRLGGLDSFVYSRGDGDAIDVTGAEYHWAAPDGSEVLAIHQVGGYCRAGPLGVATEWEATTPREVDVARAVDQVRAIFGEIGERSNGSVYLISNGCDHLPPQARLGEIIEAVRSAFPATEIRHGSLEAFVDAVRASGAAADRHAGELLGGRTKHILSGVWSTRMPLKQANDRAQTLLTGYLEPVAAYTHFMHAVPYPAGTVTYAWKLLLENHPHDSICGCSIDPVHREMEPRFAGVIEVAEQTVAAHLARLVPPAARRIEDDAAIALCVMNPLPIERTELVERVVMVSAPGLDPEDVEVVDASGGPVASVVVDHARGERIWGFDYRGALFGREQRAALDANRRAFRDRFTGVQPQQSDQFLVVQFLARLPPLGYAMYRVRPRTGRGQPPPEPLVTDDDTVENEYVRVTLYENGTFDLVDKRTGATFSGLNWLEDTEDVGDEYDYSPAERTTTFTVDDVDGEVQVVEDTGVSACLEATFTWELPVAIDEQRRKRSKETTNCRVRVRLRLTRNSPVVDVELDFENRARDHRLRAEFSTAIQTDDIVSDGHFYTNVRPVELRERPDWVQPPPDTYPQQDFSLVQDGRYGLAVFNRGLPEVAPLQSATGRAGLALTLLRAVGWLSRDDFPTRRRTNAGPMLATPDAQCQGPHRFHYAVVPFAGDWVAADVKTLSARWRTPPACVQGVEDGAAPPGPGLLHRRAGTIAVTAVKRHEERDTLVVRFYNTTSENTEAVLECGRSVSGAWRTDLLERRGDPLSAVGAVVQCDVAPHEIVTVEIAFA